MEIERLFTNGDEENATGYHRFLLKEKDIIGRDIQKYLNDNKWISNKSQELLRYLSENIVNSSSRPRENQTEIGSASQLWIARGLSGAVGFVLDSQNNIFRFYFAPRVISTSGATKILAPLPTLIVKDQGEATREEIEKMQQFENLIVIAASNIIASKDISAGRPVNQHV